MIGSPCPGAEEAPGRGIIGAWQRKPNPNDLVALQVARWRHRRAGALRGPAQLDVALITSWEP